MRVLFFSCYSFENHSYAGGGWVYSLANSLKYRGGIDLGICYPSNTEMDSWKQDGIAFFPIKHRASLLKKIINRFFCLPDFINEYHDVDNAIKNFNPDIIELFGLETAFGGIVSKVDNIPVVVHIQGLSTAIISKWFPRNYTIKECKKNSNLVDKLLKRTSVDQYKLCRCIAEREKEYSIIYKYYFGRTEWDKQLINELSNSTSMYLFGGEILRKEFYSATWHYTSEIVILSSICNGELYKGFDNILKVAKRLKQSDLNFTWNIYGVDDSFALKRIFESHENTTFNKNNVFFQGKKSGKELSEILATCTFYLHLSHIDNSPNSLCEAMLVGTPSIATNVGGLSSIITDQENGFLVEDYDVKTIADIVITYHNNPARLHQISKAAHSTAQKRHNPETIISSTINGFDRIVSDFRAKQNQDVL